MLEPKRQGLAVCLQVRLGSTRLPGKALLKIADKTLTEWAMISLKQIGVQNILLTDQSSCEALTPLARKEGFDVFVGPAEDVLWRYCLCIKKYGIKTVIRATGDNPFVSTTLACMLMEEFFEGGYEYAGYLDIPSGTGVEVVDAAALLKAAERTDSAYDREHVCPYLYKNPEQFKIFQKSPPAQFCLPGSRITVDTSEDLIKAQQIYRSTGLPAKTEDLVRALKKWQENSHS